KYVMSDLVRDRKLLIRGLARFVREADHRLSTGAESRARTVELAVDDLHAERGRIELHLDVLLRRDSEATGQLPRDILGLAESGLARCHDTVSIADSASWIIVRRSSSVMPLSLLCEKPSAG